MTRITIQSEFFNDMLDECSTADLLFYEVDPVDRGFANDRSDVVLRQQAARHLNGRFRPVNPWKRLNVRRRQSSHSKRRNNQIPKPAAKHFQTIADAEIFNVFHLILKEGPSIAFDLASAILCRTEGLNPRPQLSRNLITKCNNGT